MKNAPFLIVAFFVSAFCIAQNNASYNISLLAQLNPNIADQGIDGRRYSGCWGWYQANGNREYAISGTSNGTYFYNVSTPTAPVLCDFVEGAHGCTYREMKTLGHYCYIITDDGQSTGLQIVDLQYLPDSVSLLYEGKKYFNRAHSIWIDGSHMYLGSVTYSTGYYSMSVFSLATPTAPVHLRDLNSDVSFINTVHDLHSRHDTIFANSAYQGMYVLYYDSVQNKFTQLGSYTGFPNAGYNHSSYLTQDGKHLVFCEEIPAGLPIRMVDVSNPANIQAVSQFIPHLNTTPHNPFVKGNFAVVGCYEDGLYVYDISNPNMVSKAGFYDTYNQGGYDGGGYGTSNYRGTWGAYPFLPSGIIIANDMQNGTFLLDASAAYTTTVKDYAGITQHVNISENFAAWYESKTENILLANNSTMDAEYNITDINGREIAEGRVPAFGRESLSRNTFAAGLYVVGISNHEQTKRIKVCVQ